MEQKRFAFRERLKSFRYAFEGIRMFFHEEPNSRIHLAALILAIIAGIALRISPIEWIAVIFAAGFVFSAEIFNSSVEKLSDFASPGKNGSIKKVKDLAAAAVLISAITALIIGLIIFLPKIADLI